MKNNIKKTRCRFSTYRTSHVTENGEVLQILSIVLKDIFTGIIFLVTDLADYLLYTGERDTSVFEAGERDVVAVCSFLNYIFIENHDRYRISSVAEITAEMAQEYLFDYAGSQMANGRYPSTSSVRSKRAALSLWLEALAKSGRNRKIRSGELISVRTSISQFGSIRTCNHYRLKIKCFSRETGELQQLWRDMPLEIAERFVSLALIHDPELVFAIVLMMYVGLRGGEVCNVYRGIADGREGVLISSFSTSGSDGSRIIEANSMEICLMHEYPLRSDGKRIGGIKKERVQPVFDPCLKIVVRAYREHLQLIKNKPCERIAVGRNTILPMFLNRQLDRKTGYYPAMTKSGLAARVKSLFFNHVLPSCKNDPSIELQRFYREIQDHTWGEHAFRHYYTILLIACGVNDAVILKTMRGDKNPRSAETYLKNKGLIMKLYKDAVKRFADMILGGEIYDDYR